MSDQRTFDIVVAHLRQQGKRGQNPDNGQCVYRHNELKCAAGCLIPDSEYTPDMEGNTCKSEITAKVLIANGHSPDFVYELQVIHDGYLVEDWEERFAYLADQNDLVYK